MDNVSDCCRTKRSRDTYTIVVLTAHTSRLGVELARAARGHLVGNSLDVLVGGVGGHCDYWLDLKFCKGYWRRFVERRSCSVVVMV